MGSVRWVTVVSRLPSTASTLLGSGNISRGKLNLETKLVSTKLSSAPESTSTRRECKNRDQVTVPLTVRRLEEDEVEVEWLARGPSSSAGEAGLLGRLGQLAQIWPS